MYDLALHELSTTPGARYSCIADAATRSILAERGNGDVDPVTVLGWGGSVTAGLTGAGEPDALDDLIVTAARSYHLVRRARVSAVHPLLVYVCLERTRSNLALARRALAAVVADRLDAVPSGGGSVPGWMPQPGPAPARVVPPVRPPPSALPAPPVEPPPGEPAAGLPGPRHGVRPGAPPVPLPRRSPAPVRAPVTAPRAPTAGPRWADDVSTMRRLVAGLRALGTGS